MTDTPSPPTEGVERILSAYESGEMDAAGTIEDLVELIATLQAPGASGETATSLLNLADEFGRWLESGPENQPHNKSGMRPFSTGDLKHYERILREAAALSQPPAMVGDDAAWRRNVYRLQEGGARLCEALRLIADGCDEPAKVARKALDHKAPDPDWNAMSPAAEGWRFDMENAPRDGTLVMLLVDYSGDDADHHIDDSADGLGRTIGHNNDDNVGPDEGEGWQFAGWCWSHDHYVEGVGRPVAWRPLPDPPAAIPSSDGSV